MDGLFSNEVIISLLKRHLGSVEDWQIEAINTGKFNQSYRAKSSLGEFVLRIAPADDAGLLFYEKRMMRQEPAIHRLILEKTDIPVPEIVASDFSREFFDRDYLIMLALPGMPFSEALHLSHAKRNQVLRQVGEQLRHLHTIIGDAYGYSGLHKPMEPQSTWQKAFEIMWKKLLDDVQACGMYTTRETARYKALFDAYADYFIREVPPILLHMDVWGQNILVDQVGRLTGLLDFDRALWGDPEIEFAVLDYCGISASSFWDGYQGERPNEPDCKIRHKFYILYELQKYIPISIWRRNDLTGAEEYKQTALMILDGLSNALD